MKIKDFALKIFSGGTPNTSKKDYWDGPYFWLSSGETRNNYINATDKQISLAGVENSSTKLAHKDSIVIASAGQGFTRGQVSYLNIDTYINQSLICIDTNNKIVLSKYLYYFLKSNYTMLRSISDSSSIRGSLTTKLIGEIDVIVPKISIQQHIVDTICYFLVFLLPFLLIFCFLLTYLIIH